MLQKSHSLTATWLCLFLYSGLFTLLQEVLFPPLHLPGDLTVIVCACLAALPILCYGARTGTCKLYPANAQRLSILTFFYLFSLDFILNLTVSLSSPLIERILRLLGIGLREAPIPNGSISPLLAFYICLLGPILEELIYRGIVLQKLLPHGTRLAIILSAVCFGLMHHDFYQGLSAFLVGIIYGFIAVRYSLMASIGLHILNNSMATLLPMLKDSETAGPLITILIFLFVLIFALVGSILAIRRKSSIFPASTTFPDCPGDVLMHPMLWLVLLFDAIYLAAINFIRI